MSLGALFALCFSLVQHVISHWSTYLFRSSEKLKNDMGSNWYHQSCDSGKTSRPLLFSRLTLIICFKKISKINWPHLPRAERSFFYFTVCVYTEMLYYSAKRMSIQISCSKMWLGVHFSPLLLSDYFRICAKGWVLCFGELHLFMERSSSVLALSKCLFFLWIPCSSSLN